MTPKKETAEQVETAKAAAPQYEGLNIHQRLHAVMKQVDYVQKGKGKGDGLKYTFASHDSVTAAVRAPCVEWGIVYYPVEMVAAQDGNRTQVCLKIRFVNIDNPSDFLETPSFGYGIDGQDKGPGKAISYAVKYALLKSFGLETGDDPENSNEDHKPDPKKAIGGSIRGQIDEGQELEFYNQALASIAGADGWDSLKKVWANQWKARATYKPDHWVDIEQAYQERKKEFPEATLNGAH